MNNEIIKKIKINFNKNINILEEKVYTLLTKTDTERKEIIEKNILNITENTINEFIKTDIEIRGKKNVWVTKSLDSFYDIKLKSIILNEEESLKILPRTKDYELRLKIININIIISCLTRIKGIVLYTKLKKGDYPEDLKEKIKFTKGYLVCFEPFLVETLKEYEYTRKKVSLTPIEIKYTGKGNKVIDAINNKNFSSDIWIKKNEICEMDIEKLKINNNILYDNYDTSKLISIINYLNKTSLNYDEELLKKIDKIANNLKILDINIMTKNSLKYNIYQINIEEQGEIITDEMEIKRKYEDFINNAATYELIKKQLQELKGKNFFINYLYDSRTRIYCENWPINYQLNHIIRNIIKIEKKHEIKEIYERFMNNEYIKKYIKNYKILMSDYIKNMEIIDTFVNINCKWKNKKNDIENKFKKEILIIYLRKLSEKLEKDLNKSIKISIEIFDEFKKSNIEENIEYWIEKTKIKKIPVLLNIHKTLKDITNDEFNGTFWGDASSNAIQLITLRLGNLNDELLMLTNITENNTKYNNIYEYVTEKIKEKNHENILREIKYKITKKELETLQNTEDNKYRIMPASYGMGEHRNLKNMEERLIDRKEIWEKLNNKEKAQIAKYIWKLTFEILKDIGFNLEEYKEIFKTLENYDICTWYNDYGLPIVPINTQKSKRQNILKKINEYKEKKENLKIEKLVKKREADDKKFWKRTMIEIKNEKNYSIYVRIYHTRPEIDKRQTIQSLIPNSIHSYDSSVVALVIELCKIFEIKILVIHDSIGCNIIYAPIIKILFKIANIIILEKNTKNKPFPFNNEWLQHKYKLNNYKSIKKIKKKIIESTNFFR